MVNENCLMQRHCHFFWYDKIKCLYFHSNTSTFPFVKLNFSVNFSLYNEFLHKYNYSIYYFSVITNQIYPGEHPRASSISLMKDRRGLNTAVMLWGDGEQTNVFSFTDFDLLFPALAVLPSVTHKYNIGHIYPSNVQYFNRNVEIQEAIDLNKCY